MRLRGGLTCSWTETLDTARSHHHQNSGNILVVLYSRKRCPPLALPLLSDLLSVPEPVLINHGTPLCNRPPLPVPQFDKPML